MVRGIGKLAWQLVLSICLASVVAKLQAQPRLVFDHNQQANNEPSRTIFLAEIEGFIYFSAFTPAHGRELWRMNMQTLVTEMLCDINPKGDGNPEMLVKHGEYLYMKGLTFENQPILWRYNLRTRELKACRYNGPESNPIDSPNDLKVYNGELYVHCYYNPIGNALSYYVKYDPIQDKVSRSSDSPVVTTSKTRLHSSKLYGWVLQNSMSQFAEINLTSDNVTTYTYFDDFSPMPKYRPHVYAGVLAFDSLVLFQVLVYHQNSSESAELWSLNTNTGKVDTLFREKLRNPQSLYNYYQFNQIAKVKNKIYATAITYNSIYNDMLVYDLRTKKSKILKAFPGNTFAVEYTFVSNSSDSLFLVGNKLLSVAKYESDTIVAVAPPLPDSVEFESLSLPTVINGVVYIPQHRTPYVQGFNPHYIYKYVPGTTRIVLSGPSLPMSPWYDSFGVYREDHFKSLNGKAYIFSSGEEIFGPTGYPLGVFDPATEQLTKVPLLASSNGNSAIQSLHRKDGKLYYIAQTGNYNGYPYYKLFVHNPATNSTDTLPTGNYVIDARSFSENADKFYVAVRRTFFSTERGLLEMDSRTNSFRIVTWDPFYADFPALQVARLGVISNGIFYMTSFPSSFENRLHRLDPASGQGTLLYTNPHPMTELTGVENGFYFISRLSPSENYTIHFFEYQTQAIRVDPSGFGGYQDPFYAPARLYPKDNYIYFFSTQGSFAKLCRIRKSDHALTRLTPDFRELFNDAYFDATGLYFTGRMEPVPSGSSPSRELWTFDFTTDSLHKLTSIRYFFGPSLQPNEMIIAEGNLFLRLSSSLDYEATGYELWVYKLQTKSFNQVANWMPWLWSSDPKFYCQVGTRLYFSSIHEHAGVELHEINLLEPTPQIRYYDVSTIGSSSPRLLTNLNGKLYFVATTLQTGEELWTLDGLVSTSVEAPEIAPSSDLTVYPNPTSGEIRLRGLPSGAQNCTVTIYDLTGRVVQQQYVLTPDSDNELTLSMSHLEQGLYLLTVQHSKGYHSTRFLKH